MVDDTKITVPTPASGQPIVVQISPRQNEWNDASIYAPAMPGVIVALLGLYVAHRFSNKREKRKEILELCYETKNVVADAEEACTAAWLTPKGAKRTRAIIEAKQRLQTLGIAATNLSKKTKPSILRSTRHVFTNCTLAVDVLAEVARMREIATNDPFEDPNRAIDQNRVLDISAVAAELLSLIDSKSHDLYG